MRILISTAKEKHYLQYHYYRYLSQKTPEKVAGFEHNDRVHQFLSKNLFNRLLFRIWPSVILGSINNNLLKKVKNFKPDVIILFKGMEIYPDTLLQIKKMGIRLVNYNLDHPFDFFSKGTGNKFVSEAVPLFDLYITYSKSINKEIGTKYPELKLGYLPFGFALEDSLYEKISQEVKERNKVCFIGNADDYRAEFITAFCKAGLKVDVYGNDWLRYIKPMENLGLHSSIVGDEYWRLLRQYRIQLNIYRPHNIDSHNMRTFEIPAVGGIMLTPESSEVANFFEEGKEVLFFKDLDEAILKATRALKMSQTEVLSIRKAARARSVNSGYSFLNRSNQLYNLLSNIT